MMDNTRSNHLEKRLLTVIPPVLAVITTVVLLMNFPNGDQLSRYTSQVMVYGFLVTVALFFSVLLTEGELSPAHAVGMIGFLALPETAFPVTLWAVFIASLIGGGAMLFRNSASGLLRSGQSWRSFIYISSRVTLSFFAAGQVYLLSGGALPFTDGALADASGILIVIVYGLVYLTLYTSIFVLEVYSEGRLIQNLIRNDLAQILVVLLLPVPFALLTAQVAASLSASAAFISTLGLVLIILGLHALSRSEHRLRRQLNELRTLSVVTQAMRAHLNLNGLLKTIYVQVAHLIDATNFTVALYKEERKEIEYPLVMVDGREQTPDSTGVRLPTIDSGLIEYVLENGVPLLLNGNVLMQAQELGIDPPPPSVQSWLGVPMVAGGRNLGVIAVRSRDHHRQFTQNDLRLLNIIAASASIAIENAQLYDQQRDRAEQLTMLTNIASLLSNTLSADSVVDTVISSASAITQANAVAIYMLWDGAESGSRSIRSAGLSDEFAQRAPTPLLLQQKETVPLYRQLPVAYGNLDEIPSAPEIRKVLEQEGKVAFIEIPLANGGEDIGLLAAYYDEPQTFTGERLEMLRTFATQAAQAIKNAQTYTVTDEALQRSVEQLLALGGIGRQLTSSVDLNTISEVILNSATEATGTFTGVVALHDQHSGTLQVMAEDGYPPRTFASEFNVADAFDLGRGLPDDVLEEGQIYRVDNVNELKNYKPLVSTTQSRLIVLILRGVERIGYLVLESDKPAAFNLKDSQFVAQIANQALIAIDNAQLFDRISEARDRLQVILDAMEEAIVLVDARGEIALANPRIRMLGLEPGDLLHRTISGLLHAGAHHDLPMRLGFESADEMSEIITDLATPENWKGYAPVLYTVPNDAQGTLYIQRYVIPVKDAGEQFKGALLVFYNKTEEQELQRARDEFSRMLVHDLRSPLTAVTTSLKLLQEIVPKDADFRDMVETTTDASRRAIRKLLTRVDSLLDISKMESGRVSIDTDIAELATIADNVSVELSPLAHELDVQIVSELDEHLPLLDIDADKVERLLLNLVDNALKYAPADSAVIIRAKETVPSITSNATTNGDPPATRRQRWVKVEVIDQGPGVPEDYKETLFDSFVQVEGRRKVRRGVGLGLTFCKLVAEAHGGRIWIDDNPGGGSIFAFTLPVTTAAFSPEDTDEFSISG